MHEFSQGRGSEHADLASRLQALTHEITAAISALERNNLSDFQHHLANQEAIASELEAELKLGIRPGAEGRESSQPKQSLPAELSAACSQLAQANRVFTAMLKRASRSSALLNALYRGAATYERNASAIAGGQKISCEV